MTARAGPHHLRYPPRSIERFSSAAEQRGGAAGESLPCDHAVSRSTKLQIATNSATREFNERNAVVTAQMSLLLRAICVKPVSLSPPEHERALSEHAPRRTPVFTNRLQCVECGWVSRENERGCTARLTYDEQVVVYCPECDDREFGGPAPGPV